MKKNINKGKLCRILNIEIYSMNLNNIELWEKLHPLRK